MRVSIDLSRCQGYGNCVSAAPDVFDLDDSGLAVLLVLEPGVEQKDAVREAERMCPVGAIEVFDAGQ